MQKTVKQAALIPLVAVGLWVAADFIHLVVNKELAFRKARQTADKYNLPLINIGACGHGQPGGPYKKAIQESDVNFDIKPCPNIPNLVVGDVQELSKYFEPKSSIVFISHVIEHVDDPDKAFSEIEKVSVESYVVYPQPFGLIAWVPPEHKWVIVGKEKVRNPRGVVSNLLVGSLLIAISAGDRKK